MFELLADETVIHFEAPFTTNNVLATCTECDQVAFRILHLKSQNGERDVALCGVHLKEVCARYPEVRRSFDVQRSA